ncbi:MAG: hypothetical protein U1C12_01640 [Patescibacteria group bacterium]|nr:hypothetical protein [Patescibacteria group bacterium]
MGRIIPLCFHTTFTEEKRGSPPRADYAATSAGCPSSGVAGVGSASGATVGSALGVSESIIVRLYF